MEHIVLGASGNIGGLLVDELVHQHHEVKALARKWDPGQQKEGVTYATVDAENASDMLEATKNSAVVYLTIAIPYGIESWQHSWPVVMKNAIEAAKANKFKLVFLDNVYMYGQSSGPMTEESPIQPCSKKGEIRTQVAAMLLSAMQNKEITATIGRSADFYGPNTRISSRFFEGTFQDGVAEWPGNPDVMRTFNYTLDNAKALAILGSDARADGQVWHMPAAPAMKGTDFIALAGRILGKELKTVPSPGLDAESRAAFAKNVPEIAEMMYQYDNDYVFDSSKFQNTFGVQPTSYQEGFKHVYDELAKTAN